ncbi:hypothetical protein ACVIJ6_002444 [Bradyrhizobium sp. USDA 4369]
MLHLLPVRQLLTLILLSVALTMLSAIYAGYIGADGLHDAITVIRWSSVSAVALPIVASAAWRWMPSLQKITFPYLGGEWEGKLAFQGLRGSGTRDIKLNVAHQLFGLKLVLETNESISRTLVAHAQYDADLARNRIYYVYLNERKEGVVAAGESYKGLATLRVESAGSLLHGDYFTETSSAGTLHVYRLTKHAWWKFWK